MTAKKAKKKLPKKQSTHGAVLVNLTINQFSNEKTDKSIVQEVARTHNASFSQDRYLKRILPPAVMKSIQAQISTIRSYHYQVTAPWFDRGIRMMAAAFIMPYTNEINRLKKELFDYIKGVAKDLPAHEAEAIRTRGSLFKHGDIPSAEDFINSFNIKIELLPVSMEDDFRIDYISNKTKAELKKNNEARFKQHTEHLIQILAVPLLRMKATMENQDRAPKIHGSTIEAIDWWCDNIDEILVDRTHAPRFKELAGNMQTLITAGYDPEGKPKYDPHFIEGALDCIDETMKSLEAIR